MVLCISLLLGLNGFAFLFSVSQYFRLRNFLALLKKLHVIDLDNNIDLQSHCNDELVALTGHIKALGESLQAKSKKSIQGVIYRLKIFELYLSRHPSGLWHSQKQLIRDKISHVPFTISGQNVSVEVQEPLMAHILDLKQVSCNYVKDQPDYMEYLYTFLMGIRSSGLEVVEEMMQIDSKMLIIGKLVQDADKSLKIRPHDIQPFIITQDSMNDLSKHIASDRNNYLYLSVFLGTTFLFFSYCLIKRYKKIRRFQSQIEEVKKFRESNPRTEETPEELICVACKVNQKEILLLNCGHLCLCLECSEKISDKCPICRAKIVRKTVAFF